MGGVVNSCLYDCVVNHQRNAPKAHKICYRLFMFYLNLDEIGDLERSLKFFGFNRSNLYSFYEKDHLPFSNASLRENLSLYLQNSGCNFPLKRVMLLTNLRVLGYIFNPVSLFYCYDENDTLQAIVVEVGNTFGELKPYLLTCSDIKASNLFEKFEKKHFYVSPFAKLEHSFHFKVREPSNKLLVTINTVTLSADNTATPIVLASMEGEHKPLNTKELLLLTLRFPFVTLQVIFAIHFHALILYLKGIPFQRKESNPDLQIDILRPHDSLKR